ncbi:serine phosphatase RsbU (regulator of sigma subunit) [Nocardioides ginsengisegetis]|uniref:Serine phosphatase RsbU (Regulator of sigma subunit) n=1 Tax=Nocardioides ginsengisegetis TaxID=661491 RepID=A0A7W3PBN2_9ACTN|nr:GAF domain-containing SpoIIE family protein phosphatase [Nocardioides ginsengisegetis]MBA8805888.1 serine phosphatase RsbU (regulator of sigma subunit) [Nocardioides ginsengisegetis]
MARQQTAEVDTSFDRYARMVRNALDTPVALVTLIEESRQVFVGAAGLDEPVASTRETPLSHSFCQYVVSDESPLIVRDLREDDRLKDNPAIVDFGVVAYAGFPIKDQHGTVIGSLCALDTSPHEWTDQDLELLEDMASACSTELSERALRLDAAERAWHAHGLTDRSRVLLALSEGLSTTATLEDVATAMEEIAVDILGCLKGGIWLRHDPLKQRHAADLPLTEQESAGGLTFITNPDAEWTAAATFGALAIDDGNPAGAALVHDAPIFYRSRADQNADYPHLVNPGQLGEARAFLPLGVRGHVYGVLVLVWPDEREMSEEDRVTIAALTAYTAQAVERALLYQDRLDALVILQSSLLPRLPEQDDLDMAARYRPAATRDQVGGDWYDAVLMHGGATSLMIGDVVGHDMDAAAVMGQLRTMLRTIAWAGDNSPARNVERLDQAMRDLDVDGMASLVKARIQPGAAPDLWVLSWTNAGHPPPLLITADGSTELLDADLEADLMIGIAPDIRRTDHRTVIEAGSTLLLYTDGLVERRGEDLTAGLDRLRRVAGQHHGLPPSKFLDALLGELVGARPTDDVAVLAVLFKTQTSD